MSSVVLGDTNDCINYHGIFPTCICRQALHVLNRGLAVGLPVDLAIQIKQPLRLHYLHSTGDNMQPTRGRLLIHIFHPRVTLRSPAVRYMECLRHTIIPDQLQDMFELLKTIREMNYFFLSG